MVHSIGIVRSIDNLGRVVIPRELRRTIGLPDGTPLEIFSETGKDGNITGIVMRKYNKPEALFDLKNLIDNISDKRYGDIPEDKKEEFLKLLNDAQKVISKA